MLSASESQVLEADCTHLVLSSIIISSLVCVFGSDMENTDSAMNLSSDDSSEYADIFDSKCFSVFKLHQLSGNWGPCNRTCSGGSKMAWPGADLG